MFYNTGIATYVWILSNKKNTARRGKVQLIDASRFWRKIRKSLGSKRKELSEQHIADIARLFGDGIDAKLATALDADDKEEERDIVRAGENRPASRATAPSSWRPSVSSFRARASANLFGLREIYMPE